MLVALDALSHENQNYPNEILAFAIRSNEASIL